MSMALWLEGIMIRAKNDTHLNFILADSKKHFDVGISIHPVGSQSSKKVRCALA